MRLLICGSRDFADVSSMKEEILRFAPSLIIHGCARGADDLGAAVARELGIEEKRFPADWRKYGRAAGMIRNRQMLVEGKPDQVLAFWDGESRGTKNMIEIVQAAKIPVKIVFFGKKNREDAAQ